MERGHRNSLISLIFLNFHNQTLKMLHTIEHSSDWIDILVNKADPTMFMLNDSIDNRWSSRIYKIVENMIITCDVIETDFYPLCFYDKCAYAIKWFNEDGKDLEVGVLYMSN
jgi:uncharacterized UPF0160 family protein